MGEVATLMGQVATLTSAGRRVPTTGPTSVGDRSRVRQQPDLASRVAGDADGSRVLSDGTSVHVSRVRARAIPSPGPRWPGAGPRLTGSRPAALTRGTQPTSPVATPASLVATATSPVAHVSANRGGAGGWPAVVCKPLVARAVDCGDVDASVLSLACDWCAEHGVGEALRQPGARSHRVHRTLQIGPIVPRC
jgi:hypothetical protein